MAHCSLLCSTKVLSPGDGYTIHPAVSFPFGANLVVSYVNLRMIQCKEDKITPYPPKDAGNGLKKERSFSVTAKGKDTQSSSKSWCNRMSYNIQPKFSWIAWGKFRLCGFRRFKTFVYPQISQMRTDSLWNIGENLCHLWILFPFGFALRIFNQINIPHHRPRFP